jgi:PTS system nitrogen regulatory IIA component
MELELEELAASLNLTPATVERWIRQGRLPVRQKGNRCIFSQSSLKKWAETNHLTFVPKGSGSPGEPESAVNTLFDAMERGGIFYDIEGFDMEAVLNSVVSRISQFETPDRKQHLFESLLAREQLMSTGIGRGVAIPHPRTPLGEIDIPASISVCFLKTPIDYKALDHQPVFVLFVMVCPSPKVHLQLLARLSYCLREEAFVDFLRGIPNQDVFYEKIKAFDSRFDGPESSS